MDLCAGLLAVIPLVWVVLYFRVRHAHKVREAGFASLPFLQLAALLCYWMVHHMILSCLLACTMKGACLSVQVALMYRMALKSDSGPVIHKFVDELEVEVRALIPT